MRQLADGRGRGGVEGGAKSSIKKAWSSINHSILTGITNVQAEIKEKHGVRDPVLELTQTSPYFRVDSKVSFSPPGVIYVGLIYWLDT